MKATTKKQIADELGMSVASLNKWMKGIPELAKYANKKGSGAYLFTEGERERIMKAFKS